MSQEIWKIIPFFQKFFIGIIIFFRDLRKFFKELNEELERQFEAMSPEEKARMLSMLADNNNKWII